MAATDRSRDGSAPHTLLGLVATVLLATDASAQMQIDDIGVTSGRAYAGGSFSDLFVNPVTGTRYPHSAFRRTGERASDRAGVPKASLSEGTKHSFATDAVRRGVPERVVQRMLGHRDVTSTRRYAQLAGEAMIDALRDREGGGDLFPACPSGESGEKSAN